MHRNSEALVPHTLAALCFAAYAWHIAADHLGTALFWLVVTWVWVEIGRAEIRQAIEDEAVALFIGSEMHACMVLHELEAAHPPVRPLTPRSGGGWR